MALAIYSSSFQYNWCLKRQQRDRFRDKMLNSCKWNGKFAIMSRFGGSREQLEVSGAAVPHEKGKAVQRAWIQSQLGSQFWRKQPVLGVLVWKEESVTLWTEKLALNQLGFQLHTPRVLFDNACLFTISLVIKVKYG